MIILTLVALWLFTGAVFQWLTGSVLLGRFVLPPVLAVVILKLLGMNV